MEIQELCDKLISWLRDNVNAANAKGVVFGMSGGIDSAVVSVLCKKAFPDDAVGFILPCYSDDKDEQDAILVAEKFKIKYKKIELNSIYDEFLNKVDKTENRTVKANIKPRLRMITLYYYAGINNYLVVGSQNKSELTVGYFTKYGDNGDLLPIANLVKKQVYELASYLGIPEPVITKTPTAGLWPGQTDEKEMGITYDELDSYILTGEAKRPEVKEKIDTLYRKSEHKRRLPLIPSF